MNSRSIITIFGWFLGIIVGIPLLAGAIGATALVLAFINPKTVTTLASSLFRESDVIFGETYAIVATPGVVKDPNNIAWVQAFEKTSPDPVSFLKGQGLFTYLETETASVGAQLIALTQKKSTASPQLTVAINYFKKLIISQDTQDYVLKVLRNLPPCDEKGTAAWEFFIANNMEVPAPGCQPPAEMEAALIDSLKLFAQSLPNSVSLLPPAALVTASAGMIISLVLSWVAAAIILVLAVYMITPRHHLRAKIFGLFLLIPAILGAALIYLVVKIPGQANWLVFWALPQDVTVNWTPALKLYLGSKIIELSSTLLRVVAPSLYATALVVALSGILLIVAGFSLQKSGMLKR